MARRSDFTQKLLDDLRLRKERMGLLPPGQQRSSSSSLGSVNGAGYKNSRWSFRGSGEAAAPNNLNRNKSPLLFREGSEEIVPYGRSRSREHTIDLSMALAMALANSGKLQNIEVLENPALGRKKIVLHMDGMMAYQSPSQIGEEVAKGVQNLNMILRACSRGFNFDRGYVEIGRELLKGAMDLEEALKMLMAVQDASDYMVGLKKKQQQQVRLLKGKEEEEEEEEEWRTHRANQWKAGNKTKFSFIRERRGTDDEKTRCPANNSNGNSSKSSLPFISHCRSISGSSGLKSEAPAASKGRRSHELVRVPGNGVSSVTSKENVVSEKVRMPNIIAKLMGLEELPAPAEAKSVDAHRACRSPQLKEMSNKLVEIDEVMNKEEEGSMMANSSKRMSKNGTQEKGTKNMTKSDPKGSRNSENMSPGSKDSLKTYGRNNGKMDHNSEVLQEEISIAKQQMRGRMEKTASGSGNSLTGKKDEKEGRDEKAARKQTTKDKIVQIDSSFKIINSDHQQKRNLIIPEAKNENFGKNKELIQRKVELVLNQQREAENQSHNERNTESIEQLQFDRSKTGEGIKEIGVEKKTDANSKLQLSMASKRVMKSKDIEKHPKETRVRTQFSKGVNSDKNDLVNKTGSQLKKENLKIITDGTNIRNKSIQNHHRERNLKEQSSYKRLPLKTDTRAEKMARTSMKATVMKKPAEIQSVQKVNIIKVKEEDTNRRSSAEVNVQKISMDASQAMEQRSSILQELENRWKERKKNAEGIEEGSEANLELTMQQRIEIISSVNLPEDNGDKETTTCDPISGEDTKTFACSSPHPGDVNIHASLDEPIQEEINAKSEKENSVYQLPERSSITMTDYADKFFQEDSTQKYKEIQSSFTENEKEDHSRIKELNSSKSIVYEDRTIMEEDQQEALTEDEETLKQTLITSHNFLNVAQSLFQINIPVDILQNTENVSPDKDARLIIDCGNELLKRKSKREVPSFFRKGSLAPLERRSIDILIKEVNADLESLKYRNYTEGCDYDLADWLNKTIEKDIQNRHPDINCLWDVGWENNTIACLENNEIARDVEKNVLNGLLNELSRDLLNVSISIF